MRRRKERLAIWSGARGDAGVLSFWFPTQNRCCLETELTGLIILVWSGGVRRSCFSGLVQTLIFAETSLDGTWTGSYGPMWVGLHFVPSGRRRQSLIL